MGVRDSKAFNQRVCAHRRAVVLRDFRISVFPRERVVKGSLFQKTAFPRGNVARAVSDMGMPRARVEGDGVSALLRRAFDRERPDCAVFRHGGYEFPVLVYSRIDDLLPCYAVGLLVRETFFLCSRACTRNRRFRGRRNLYLGRARHVIDFLLHARRNARVGENRLRRSLPQVRVPVGGALRSRGALGLAHD